MRPFRSEVRKEFNAVHARLAGVDERFDKLQSAVDAYMKLGETYYQDMLGLGTKVGRLERLLHQVADKVGIKLEYLARRGISRTVPLDWPAKPVALRVPLPGASSEGASQRIEQIAGRLRRLGYSPDATDDRRRLVAVA